MSLRGDCRTFQRRLKALGVEPSPPAGKPRNPLAMKPGQYYALPVKDVKGLAVYVDRLRAALDAADGAWTEKAHAHAVLVAANEAASGLLPHPFHGGVPARPAFGNPGHLRVLFFLLQQVVPSAAERKAHAAAEDIVVGMLNPHLRSKAEQRKLQHDVVHGTAGALARLVTNVAFRSLQQSPVDPLTRQAAAEVVRLLDRPKRLPFLRALDAVVLREDLAAVLDGRFDGARVDTVLFRAARDGKTTHWLGRLKGGGLVLVWKVKGKFHVVHGEKDDVLASVPEEHMRAAISAAR